ncbi:tyrosine-type recombinase/integrase [Micromonospora sp. b486]|nr:tyrosine-type recombinase/integrase [Micromonospora sp. b486]MDM4784684.1 tyrosine-type recombinase/integrase [Micromonospora sp. b486]
MATTRGRRNSARWAVALALGLRQGEALGLRWSDVDLDAGTLIVRRGRQRPRWEHGCPLTVRTETRRALPGSPPGSAQTPPRQNPERTTQHRAT